MSKCKNCGVECEIDDLINPEYFCCLECRKEYEDGRDWSGYPFNDLD